MRFTPHAMQRTVTCHVKSLPDLLGGLVTCSAVHILHILPVQVNDASDTRLFHIDAKEWGGQTLELQAPDSLLVAIAVNALIRGNHLCGDSKATRSDASCRSWDASI